MNNYYTYAIKHLQSVADEKYCIFNTRIVQSSLPLIGAKVPLIRAFAKELLKEDSREYIRQSRAEYFDETLLLGIVIATRKYSSYEELIEYFDIYLPRIESWATCDTFCSSFKQIKKNKESFIDRINSLVASPNPWHKRVGFVILLCYYIDDEHIDTILHHTTHYRSDHYYVSMAVAWLLSYICIKYPDRCVDYLNSGVLDTPTFKRTIQKIKDSSRINDKANILTQINKR